MGASNIPAMNLRPCLDRVGRLLDDVESLRATSLAAEASYRRAARLLLQLEHELEGVVATALDQELVR